MKTAILAGLLYAGILPAGPPPAGATPTFCRTGATSLAESRQQGPPGKQAEASTGNHTGAGMEDPAENPADSISHGDCAYPVDLRIGEEYLHAESPEGFGNMQEFNGRNPSSHLFPSELNTVWYRFVAPANGTIVFMVFPFSARDDYDWMLFKSPGPGACDSIFHYGILPLRSNRARNDLKIDGRTGLAEGYENLHAPPGPGNSHSKPLPVKRGETYLLVLDNIYPGGQGHRILVNYTGPDTYRPVRISARIIDKASGEPLSARYYAEDDSTSISLLPPAEDPGVGRRTGRRAGREPGDGTGADTEAGTGADTESGTGTGLAAEAFAFDTAPGTPVRLGALKEGYLLAALDFRAGSRDTNVVIEMERAEKGSKMILFNIRFLPNKADFQPDSGPELERLLEFMRQSPDKYIRITGHTNANVFTSKSWLLDLSVYRAAAVRDFLTAGGIDPARIRIAGAGGSRPLVKSNDMREAMKNLRVEIQLLN